MEFLLLWVDDLDDALGAARHLAPRLLGVLAAILVAAVLIGAVILAMGG